MIKPSLEDALCPRCGKTRPPRVDECPSCGVVFRKYAAVVRQRQLADTPAPKARRGPDWNRPPLYAAIAVLIALLWQAGALWQHALATVDEATRVNSVATGGAPLAVTAFSCGEDAAGTVVARGEVQNRTPRSVALVADIAYLVRADGADTTRHAQAEVVPAPLPSLALARFEITLPHDSNPISECRVASLSERGGAPLPFDGIHD